jgi:hypothetical protein
MAKRSKSDAATEIRDRVKELRRVRAGDLVANPQNWRTHPKSQQDALRGILAEVGYADALLARELPDGSLQLVDGHLRAETTPDQVVPVLVLDINAAESRKLLLSLDPLASMAETNRVALDDLLREVDTGSDALQELFAGLAHDAGLYGDDPVENRDEDSTIADVAVIVGGLKMLVRREDYDEWLESVRQQVGYDEKSLAAEFRRRLDLPG